MTEVLSITFAEHERLKVNALFSQKDSREPCCNTNPVTDSATSTIIRQLLSRHLGTRPLAAVKGCRERQSSIADYLFLQREKFTISKDLQVGSLQAIQNIDDDDGEYN
jgi:hypothetical protein